MTPYIPATADLLSIPTCPSSLLARFAYIDNGALVVPAGVGT